MLAASASCACKGIRSCDLCQPTKEPYVDELLSNTVFIYCDGCRQAIRMDVYESNSRCPHHQDIGNADIAFPIDGIYLVPDFLNENEEKQLAEAIDQDVWIPSQSGRLKQDFGIKINFKKQTIKTKYFTGMPLYSVDLIERLQSHRLLQDFQSVELCNLDYRPERGSHIDPHIDDTWIWGERLITINLLSNTILILIPNEHQSKKTIYIPLPRRWMIVLYGDARYEYKHAIQRQHIHDRRIAVTFRELTSKDEKFYDENKDLYERIVRIGKRFTGISVGRFEHLTNSVQAMHVESMNTDADSTRIDQVKSLVESRSESAISSFTALNASTYLMNNGNECLVKLVSSSSISLEQLKLLLSSYQLDATIFETPIDQSHLVLIDRSKFVSVSHLGCFVAQWRLTTRASESSSPVDDQWWNEHYALILQQKKTQYPFLLANLFTCQEQISSQTNHRFETGRLWTTNQIAFYLLDLASILLDAFPDSIEEIIRGYEEILPLTNEELNMLDTFVRLQLILSIIHQNTDDEKQWDRLEYLSSNVFCIRSRAR